MRFMWRASRAIALLALVSAVTSCGGSKKKVETEERPDDSGEGGADSNVDDPIFGTGGGAGETAGTQDDPLTGATDQDGDPFAGGASSDSLTSGVSGGSATFSSDDSLSSQGSPTSSAASATAGISSTANRASGLGTASGLPISPTGLRFPPGFPVGYPVGLQRGSLSGFPPGYPLAFGGGGYSVAWEA